MLAVFQELESGPKIFAGDIPVGIRYGVGQGTVAPNSFDQNLVKVSCDFKFGTQFRNSQLKVSRTLNKSSKSKF